MTIRFQAEPVFNTCIYVGTIHILYTEKHKLTSDRRIVPCDKWNKLFSALLNYCNSPIKTAKAPFFQINPTSQLNASLPLNGSLPHLHLRTY